MKNQEKDVHHESLSEEAANILGEAKMVIPGVQTIFGFQLVAVFSSTFSEKLTHNEQYLHLGSMLLLAWSMALLMAPAAFHRRTRPDILSRRWVTLSSYFLAWGMNLFMFSVAIEVYLISSSMGLTLFESIFVAASVFLIFLISWVIYPRFFVK